MSEIFTLKNFLTGLKVMLGMVFIVIIGAMLNFFIGFETLKFVIGYSMVLAIVILFIFYLGLMVNQNQ